MSHRHMATTGRSSGPEASIGWARSSRTRGSPDPRCHRHRHDVGPLHGRKLGRCPRVRISSSCPAAKPTRPRPPSRPTCRHWLGTGLDRSGSVLAIGGGIVTDTVGFAAAIYLRGHRLDRGADDPARDGRRRHRRQDRGQPDRGQEPGRCVLASAPRDRRHRHPRPPLPSASSAPGSPRSSRPPGSATTPS